LLRHFVRGYFDGDGSIGFNKPNTIWIKIVGANKQFIYDLAQIFKDELGIPINHKKVRNI
jgi:intein/homing endonuclease